jgi:hypothetical protein
MNLKSDLLSNPGFFHCDRSHCTLRVEICLKRQALYGNGLNYEFLICENCSQGKQNIFWFKESDRMPKKSKKPNKKYIAEKSLEPSAMAV